MKDVAFGAFVLFYYTSVLGVSGSLAGAVLLIAMIWDALTDPIVGSISDNLRTRWGRRHPLMAVSVIPLAACLYLLFAVPADLGEWGKVTWMLCVCLALRTFLTLFSVPYLALGAELSDDYLERSSITGLRVTVGWLGAIVLTSAAWGVIFESKDGIDGRLLAGNYVLIGVVSFFLVVLFAVFSIVGTRSNTTSRPADEPVAVRFTFKDLLADIVVALDNHNFRTMFLLLLTFGVFSGLFLALGTHTSTYFWELTTDQLLIQSLSACIPTLFMMAVMGWLNERVEKQTALKACIAVLVVNGIWFIPGRLLGWMPDNHTTGLFSLVLLHGYISVAALIWFVAITSSMIADIADEQELLTRKRQEGMFFAAQGFSIKFVSGVGTFAGGLIIDFVGLPPGAAPGTVDEQVLFELGMVMGPGLVFLLAVPYVFARRFNLSRARHAEIRVSLDARNA